jgi:protein-tyrosine-phosphatase
VCTGNRFRSPLAAALFTAEAEGLPVEVASLGTLDLGPEPALPEAVAIAEGLRLDLSDHRARRIDDLTNYDLVVGFERKHVKAAVVDAGAAVEKTFTLPELLELLRTLSEPRPIDPRARIQAAHAARPPDFRTAPIPEIADPLGLSAPVQRDIAHEVEEQVAELSEQLFD